MLRVSHKLKMHIAQLIFVIIFGTDTIVKKKQVKQKSNTTPMMFMGLCFVVVKYINLRTAPRLAIPTHSVSRVPHISEESVDILEVYYAQRDMWCSTFA